MKCDHITFVQTKRFINGTRRVKKLKVKKTQAIGGFPTVRKDRVVEVAGEIVSYEQLMRWVKGEEKHPLGHFEQCNAELKAQIGFYTIGCGCCSSQIDMNFDIECTNRHHSGLHPYLHVSEHDLGKFVSGELKALPDLDRDEEEAKWLQEHGY